MTTSNTHTGRPCFQRVGTALLSGRSRPTRPVRRGSYKAGSFEGAFWKPTSRKEVSRILRAAQRYEIEYREKGRRNGPLGGIALEVLSLLTNVVSFRTGRLEPSLEWIMGKLRRSKDAVVRALKALRVHGFLDWVRRYEPSSIEGKGPQVRQASNAYRLSAPKRALALLGRWAGKPSLPDDEVTRIEQAGEIEAEHVASLALDQFAAFQLGSSPLGLALESLGKAIGQRESAKRSEYQSTLYKEQAER